MVWTEATGWHAAGAGPASACLHYLPRALVPEPEVVADFADNLLRGGQPGQASPTRQRSVEHGPWALLAALTDVCPPAGARHAGPS